MYDKSKKTWSQRLKIHRNDKSELSLNTAASVTATQTPHSPSSIGHSSASPLEGSVANVGHHNVSIRSAIPAHYQITPATAIMHLPTALSMSDYHHGGGVGAAYDYMTGRSMKYAEPWIYGTVRGIPARPAAGLYHPAYAAAYAAGHRHAAAIFAAPTDMPTATPAVAVVLCSCPEYLSGTKGRTLKKASVCKKCKGTRLPLANIGGTVRVPSNIQTAKLRPVGSSATVRVVSSTKKQRPTILDPQKDPYDLMRRTRLLSPEPGNMSKPSSSGSKEKSRSRGKSASPVRGRSRTRQHQRALLPAASVVDSSKVNEAVDDSWLTEGEALAQTSSASHSRKSILRCNVNPYDLISINAQGSPATPGESCTTNPISSASTPSAGGDSSKKSTRRQKLQFSQNEFMPPSEEFNVHDAALAEDEPPFIRHTTSVKGGEIHKQEVHAKADEMSHKPQTSAQQRKSKKPNYSNVQAIAGQRISLGAEQQTSKSLIQQSADGTSTYESFSMESGPSKPREADSVNKATRPDTLPVQPAPPTEAEPKRPPRANKQQLQLEETKETKTKENPDEEEITVTVTVTPTYNIKSILKRPSSKTSEVGDTSQATDGHSKASTPGTPKLRDTESKADTPINSRRHQPTTSSPATTAQFYIPLPQARKKVQFMVEDSEEGDALNDDDSDTDGSGISTSGDLGTNYEYYNRKRNQKKLLIEEDPAEYAPQAEPDHDGHVVTYDEQFIQAMLLEKLQLDSELVTKRQQEQEHNTTTLHINENEMAENQSTADDIAAQIIKTNYGNAISCPIQPKDTALSVDNATNAGAVPNTTTTDTTRMSTKQQQQQHEHEHEHGQIPNTIRPTKTTIAPFGTATTSMQLTTSSHVAGPIQSVIDVRGTAGDSDDKDLPAQDKSTVVSIESVDNGHDGLDDDDDSDATTSGNGDYDDDSGNNDDTLSHEVPSNDDGYEDKNAIYVVTTTSAMDTKVQVAFGQAGDNNLDDGAVNVSSPSPASKAQHYGVTKSTTSPAVPTISSGVCNDQVGDDATSTCGPEKDDVKSKQEQRQQQRHHHHPQQQRRQQQQQQQRQQQLQRQQKELPKCNKKKMNKKDMQTSLAASGTTDSTGEASGPTDIVGRKLTKETQSRNPIRRSQSERQPSSMTYQQHSNRSNNKFKTDASAGNDDDAEEEEEKKGSWNIKPNASNGLKDTSATNKINDGSGNNNNSELNFHDTMALRKRSNRSDARDLFTMGGLIGRPREPPPPPPPSSGQVAKEEAATAALKASAHLAKPSEVITAEAAAIESTYQRTVSGLESKQQKTTIGQANNGSRGLEVNGGNTNRVANDISVQQEQSGQRKKVINTVNGARQASSDNMSPVGIFNSSVAAGKQQRTVVRVAPFNKTSPAFEVHRLKITHTDHGNDALLTPTTLKTPTTPGIAHSSHYSVTDLSTLSPAHDYGQQKTSILINGDDCYSTMNLSCDEYATPLYQSSVVVTDGPSKDLEAMRMTNSFNTVTINVSSPRSSEDELIHQHNQLNNLLKRQAKSSSGVGSIRAIIPIRGTIDVNLQRSASSTSSASTSSMTSTCSSTSSSTGCTSKRGKTLIRLDYDKEKTANIDTTNAMSFDKAPPQTSEWLPHETELLKILRNPVEAVKRNLVPHICKLREDDNQKDSKRSKKMKDGLKETPSDLQESLALTPSLRSPMNSSSKPTEANSFIGKLLEDPMLNQVAEGLESETVAELIENSLKRLQESRNGLDMTGTKDNDDMNRLIDLSLKRIQEERYSGKDHNNSANTTANSATTTTTPTANGNLLTVPLTKDEERLSNRGSISSANSFASAHNYELFDFDAANESDCYQSCSSEINSLLEDDVGSAETKSKFYQMLVDATLQEIELSTNTEDLNIEEEHQYESIRHNIDPIYEEISDMPPPLPLTAPPLNDPELEKKSARSIFEGASKYDILSYLVDAKERGVVKEEPFDYPLNCSNPIIIEEESSDTLSDLGKLSKLKRLDTISSRSSILSDSSEDNQSTISSLSPPAANNFMLLRNKQAAIDIERNDSGVGSETSKTSRSKFLNPSHNSSITSSFSSTTSSSHSPQPRSSPLHLCEDCDGAVETQLGEDGIMFAPLVCRKCGKKRVERKEIITEVVETEEKYGRDLQIILEEFCHPMLVAGLLTQEQLSAIFLNTEELLENNQTLAERMRDALDIALEQGDDDLLTVNIGKIFLESTQMLHAFESYCVRQAGASLLLANLEKDKELLRIFLKVSQMENAVLRRMNLNSFLMVPVQRVTKYPLLLARLYKVTPAHLEGRDLLKQAQEKIELHLNHINQEAKDVPTKLWRRISSSSPNRRASCEIDMINIKLRKMAIDVLEWNHDEVRFVMEGKLLYTQPTDSNWKKARTIKLTSVNALLVTNGKPSTNYKAEKVMSDKLNFPKHTGIREASLLVVKEKCGRYALIREPLYLDRCVVCSEADWDEYFEIQEISSKDTFIFKAEDNVRTKQWYTQLQYHAQGMGAWRKRRNALANIMINGMLTRS